jgi:hypothetical protein
MIKFIKILCLTCVLCAAGFAQNQTDEYKKNEFYVGYSHQQIDRGNYRPGNGFEGAYVRNIHKYFGIKGSVSGAYSGDEFIIRQTTTTTPTENFEYRQKVNTATYNFLGGVQVKNNASEARFKPFAHALAGVAVTRNKFSLTCTTGNCPPPYATGVNFNFNDTNFAAAVGGGLDIRINDRIDFRAIQVDYNPIFAGGGGSIQHNVRFGIGVVFK